MPLSAELIESEFPIKKQVAYFNNASYTPMSSSAIQAITDAVSSYSLNGPDDQYYLKLKDGANLARERLASILNVKPSNIVFTESATQSINLVASGFSFARGDTIITRGGPSEHPSNFLPWKYYARVRGVAIHDLATDELGFPDLSELDSALKQTHAKLVIISHVLYNLGTIMPAKEVAKISHERGALFFLDASQSIGNMPTDLADIDCDFAAGTAAKWLCGPLGLGFFYCKDEDPDNLEPLNFGANACSYKPDGSYEVFRNVNKLQEGFRNWAYTYGLSKAIDLTNEIGLKAIRERNLRIADMVIESIQSLVSRYRFLGIREDRLRTSIVPLEPLEEKGANIVSRLSKNSITIAEREIGERKILRISPHFYNDEREVEKLIAAL